METFLIPGTDLRVSRVAYGCMNIGGTMDDSPLTPELRRLAREAVEAALEAGINFFDHADIYAAGKSEAVFGEILAATPGLRDRIILQSKCGIRMGVGPREPKRYDFSYAHIVGSVERVLRRLVTDRLDILLLHRPDPLADPEEVARAFDDLHASGKVRHFGVSNHAASQIELLRRYVRQPLVVNQLQLSLAHAQLIDEGVTHNDGPAPPPVSGTLDYCRALGIRVQAWAALGGSRFLDSSAQTDEATRQTVALVAELAAEKGTAPEAILLAWLLRHPAGIQPLIGSTRPERIRACAAAAAVELSREEWYALFTAARGAKLP